MGTLKGLLRRNVRMFFHDKGLFFTSLITPMILLVLYISFLGGIYRDAFLMTIPAGLSVPERVIDGLAGGQLISSILSVSCVTVAFCSNMLSVQDKVSGVRRDIDVSSAPRHTVALAYYLATVLSTLTVCLAAMLLCFVYLAVIGWYLSFLDVILLLLDVVMLVLFGTLLSSIINLFLSTQGQISAVGTIVSSGYGFIAGAYMPISQFSEGLQAVLSLLPGTHGTALLRTHAMRGAIAALGEAGVPATALDVLRDSTDCRLYVLDAAVSVPVMYAVILGTVALLLGAYILLHTLRSRRTEG